MKFKPLIPRQRMTESFDKEKITITKMGKTYNVYDSIQENREDTEIYPTLEKYGCIPQEQLQTDKVMADFTSYGDLRDLKDQQIMANNMFYSLPFEVRKNFNNDIHTFIKDGPAYIQKKIDEERQKMTAEQQIEKPVVTPTTTTEA